MLVLGVLNGVLVAVALSVGDLLRQVARPHDGILGYVPGWPGMHDVDDYPDAQQVPGLVVYRYDSPLFFANAEDFRHRALARSTWPSRAPGRVAAPQRRGQRRGRPHRDRRPRPAARELDRRGVVLALARVKQDLRDDLDAAGLVDAIGTDRMYPTLPTAVAAYLAWHEERHGRPPLRPCAARDRRLPLGRAPP